MAFSSGSLTILETVAELRALSAAMCVTNREYRTRGYIAAEDGGGQAYYWDPDDTTTDDGVLFFKATPTTGRFRYRPRDDSRVFNCLSAGPALANLGVRTKSFDPTGVVEIGSEMYRVTLILREAGYASLYFPRGVNNVYNVAAGDCFVAASTLPHRGFSLISDGALLRGNVGVNVGSSQFGIQAYGLGETNMPNSTITVPGRAGNLTWTQTLGGGETQMTNVNDITGLAVGDMMMVYIGADDTDAGGWCAWWYIAEIKTLTPTSGSAGHVTFKQQVPGKLPAGVGINPTRDQTHHTMRKVVGFQDDVGIEGFRIHNVSIAPQGARNFRLRNHYETCNFGINAYACEGLDIQRATADRVTGYDTGGGGAFSHYGTFVLLQSCYGSHIGVLIVDNLDGVPCITEEIRSFGTRIDLFDVKYDGTLSPIARNSLITQTPNSPGLITVGTAVLRGSVYSGDIAANVRIQLLDYQGPDDQPLGIRASACDAIRYKGRTFTLKNRKQYIMPIPSTATTEILHIPQHGITRHCKIYPSTMIGVSNIKFSGIGGLFFYPTLTSEPLANEWYDVAPVAELGLSTPNYMGYNLSVHVTGDGTTPPGAYLTVEVETFEFDLYEPGSVDDSIPTLVGSDGAPTFSALFLGQKCLNMTSTPRTWYEAVGVGGGAADWVLAGPGGTSAGFTVFNGAQLNSETTYLTSGPSGSATQVRYPTGARTISTMRVTKVSSTNDVALTVTLMKNTSAQTQTVTMLTTDANGAVRVDSAHPIAFSANDTFDVRLTGGTGEVSVILE